MRTYLLVKWLLCALVLSSCATTSSGSPGGPAMDSRVSGDAPCTAREGSLDGRPAYIVCGQAERSFDDDTQAELMAEAQMEAKMALLKFLAGDRPVDEVEVQMSGFRLLKAWKKGKLYFGRYAVFVEDVTVEAGAP